MKEELQTALADLISKTLQGVDASKDFLTAEIPDVINQLMMWHGAYSFIVCFMMFLILVVLAYINIKVFRVLKYASSRPEEAKKLPSFITNYDRTRVDWVGLFPICLINLFAFVPFIVILENLDWLQVWIAPKVWLIEYMGRLVK